jgi:SAM-dependent methyltransferase
VEGDRAGLTFPGLGAALKRGESLAVNLLDVVDRKCIPKPWAEGEKIPWNDPDFSKRMLREHLSQEHNAASRRFEIVDNHVRWMHDQVLKGKPAKVLDLACGPGLYANRLAGLGHRCVGIDFSPASIAYAQEQARAKGLDVSFIQHDIRTADYGDGYGFAMLIFGEFNVFRPVEAREILTKTYRALAPGGLLLLEPHTFETVREIGMRPSTWYSSQSGLFSENPYLCLQENLWDEDSHVTIERYYIVGVATGEVTRHSSSMQAYTNEEYRALLAECGFEVAQFGLPPEWNTGGAEMGLLIVLAQKMPAA